MSHLRKTWVKIGGLVITASCLAGCGGSETPAEEVAPVPAPAPAPVVAQPAAAAAPAAAVAPAPPPPPAPKPKRPDVIAQWQPDDMRSALKERDARLIDAINAYGLQSAGKADALPFLLELLQPEKPPENPANGAPPGPPRMGMNNSARAPDGNVVVALIAAIGKNNTPESVQILDNLLRGGLDPGINPKQVMQAVLNALFDNPSPSHYEMLLTAAFTPEQFRPPVAAAEPAKMTLGGGNRDVITPADIGQEASNKLKSATTPELRMLIAARIAAEPSAIDPLNPFLTMLLEPRAENVPAQVLLFSQSRLDPVSKQKLQLLLTQLAMVTIDQMLGIPQNTKAAAPTGYVAGNWLNLVPSSGSMNALASSNPNANYRPPAAILPSSFESAGNAPAQAGRMTANGGAARPAAATNQQAANMLAAVFWNPQFRSLVLNATEGADSIQKTLPSAIFAAAIPAADTRAKFAQLNKGLWDEGPRDLKFGTLFGEALHDPGLLLVIKGTPRKEDPERADKRSGKVDPRRANNGSGLLRRPATAGSAKDKPRFEWMQASEEMVYVLNARFLAAAKAAPFQSEAKVTPVATTKSVESADEPATETDADAAEKPKRAGKPAKPSAAPTDGPDQPDDDAFGTRAEEPTEGADGLPVELHENANVVARYDLNWPADLQEKLPGMNVDPLIIHYVRIEELNRGGKLMTHYQKYLKGAKVRTIDRGRWLDQVDEGTAAGRRRSIDVMIANVNPPAPPPPPNQRGRDSKPKSTNEPVIVEILSIEIPNPYPDGDEAGEGKDSKAAKSAKSSKSGSETKEAKSDKKPVAKKPAAKPATKKSDDDA